MTKLEDKRGQVSITILVPASTVEQLDLYVEDFRHCNPGKEFNRADAVRSILGVWQSQRINKAKQLAQKASTGGTQ